jgi:hypothetical protein
LGRLLLYCLGYWRKILCAIQRDADANFNCYNDSKTYSHAEAGTITEASPDSGSAPLVR